MNTIKFAKKLVIPLLVALAYGPAQGLAAPVLGSTLSSFAVLGASDVTSASVSTIGGNLGSFPTAPTAPASSFNFLFGSYQPSFPGTELTAQVQLDAAQIALGGSTNATPTSLGGTWAPGTYDFGAGLLASTQTMTLDGGGSNTAVWIFRFASTLTTVQGSIFNVQNVGNGAGVGVYWNVGSSATLDGDTFAGNVLAYASITTDGGLNMSCGRLLADTGNVVLSGSGNKVSTGCLGSSLPSGNIASAPGSTGFDQVAAIPEPETYAMLLAGLGLMGFVARRRQRNLAAAA